MRPINVDEALKKDVNFQAGLEEYQIIETKANNVAEEISSTLIEAIVKESDTFNISTAIMAVAKTLSHLASYLYDTEEEFLTDVKKARESVVSDIIPTLLNPQPCEKCEECRNGNSMDCINPEVRGDYTTSRFLPILCNMLVEYDLFNKILYMHTVGKENSFDMAFDEKNTVEVAKQNQETNKEAK